MWSFLVYVSSLVSDKTNPGSMNKKKKQPTTTGTDKISDTAMPLKLVPHKLERLGARGRIRYAAGAPEYGPVEGEHARPLDELHHGAGIVLRRLNPQCFFCFFFSGTDR